MLAVIMFAAQCTEPESKEVEVRIEDEAYEFLSEYRFFKGDLRNLEPNNRVLPYELINPLFTDYAQKARFVYIPPGMAANYTDSGVLDFPVGTVLIKNFYYSKNQLVEEPTDRIIETRLLVHRTDGWDALPYIWNEEQTDARLEIAGGTREMTITHAGEELQFTYLVPNKNQCKGCHINGNTMMPIGPKASNLNSDLAYIDGSDNQLQKWVSESMLAGLPADPAAPQVVWDDPSSGSLEERSKAYLEINCGHCHSKEGPAATSGLYLVRDEDRLTHFGVCKTPVAAGQGSGNNTYDIDPGNAQGSILVYRMESLDPGIRMPEVGRNLVHREGVELISAWIDAMEFSCD
jgi:uncharacterized repeat protein (TIGR03806 family)